MKIVVQGKGRRTMVLGHPNKQTPAVEGAGESFMLWMRSMALAAPVAFAVTALLALVT